MADIDADPPGTFGPRQMKAAAIEFIASTIFVFVGGASVAGSGKLSADEMTVDRVIGISLCHGLAFIALSIMVRFMHKANSVEGEADHQCGYMNPAYTLSAAAVGKIQVGEAFSYIVAQFMGSIVGAAFLYGCVGDNTTKGVGSLGGTFVQKGLQPGSAMIMEMMLSFILFYVLFSVSPQLNGTDEDPMFGDYNGPIASGLTMTGCMLVGVPLTGASMNPARSFGPAVFNGQFGDLWIYLIGPLFGGALSGTIWKMFFHEAK